MTQKIGSAGVNSGGSRGALRVLMQNRSNTFTQRGGDTVLMERLSQGLQRRGVLVTIDLAGTQNPKDFDIVHIFNFALPDMVKHFGEQAQRAGVPFVVTTLAEDVPEFHNRSIAYGSALIEYVERAQDRTWWKENHPSHQVADRAPRFENAWAAEHASALFSNGSGESAVLKREYPNLRRVVEVPLGHQIGAEGKKDIFVKQYGVSDFVLCVGRIETRKNQLMLLKALEDSELTVVLAGGGFTYQPTYARAVERFKRRGKTIVLDKISPVMLASAYCAARVHVLPSWYELPGLVSLEAASYGCPIVVSDTGTTADYVGSSGWYVDPASEHSILNAVYAAYYGPFKEGLKEVAMKYSWEETAEQTLKEYQQILGTATSESRPAAPTRIIDVGQFDMSSPGSEFDRLLEEGEEAARLRQYNLAHEILERAERMDTTSVRALRARGAVYMAENLISQARRYFDRALLINASDAKSLSGLGMCELNEGRPEQAYDLILRALEIEPFQLVAILQLVQCSYMLERFDALERVLSRYLEQSPYDLEMRYCLAGCFYKRGKYSEAGRELDTILAKNASHQGSLQLKQILAEQASGQTGAVAQSVAAAPAQAAVSPAAQVIQDLEAAKHDRRYEYILEVSEETLKNSDISRRDQHTIQCLRAEALVFSSRLEDATRLFSDILSVDGECVRALCGRGAIASAEGDSATARSSFEKALRIAPRNDVALAGLGMIEQAAGNVERAWSLYRDSLSVNAENHRALYGVIEVGYQSQRFSEIEENLKAYLDCHPGDINYLYSLAGCYYAQGRLADAADELAKILIFDPQNRNALELQRMINERSSSPGHDMTIERVSSQTNQ